MIDHVRPAQLTEWLAATSVGARPLVLDVREPWELQTASVKAEDGFDVATIPMGDLPSRLAELDRDRPIACLCHHGMRSLRVATYLDQQGFDRVANISGGIDAWSHERDTAVPRY
ncbi:rhodanese-like domain-containing protein [Paracidovorax valerianellae]|uniref:Rhodanese-related sulfurtransferase n=1 Tax=Paracidovorax valerianellae TaxID=187868 RepID=A0A1G6I017_9BURK|nr:rhodanese-like domain-containing protein [Paracidovorax valerianellae]MDA8446972.1 rhodanese-like domain-containing protein [Paracidovorax valerianellae]SDB99780.1 Rhodanese-related sulfurtransferase [Paracidovorax valerianellae]